MQKVLVSTGVLVLGLVIGSATTLGLLHLILD
jgi:hypothetical protein